MEDLKLNEEIETQLAKIREQNKPSIVQDMTEKSEFAQTLEIAKVEQLKEATAQDGKFVEQFREKLKEATLKNAQVEKEKARLEEQNVKMHQELLATQQQLNQQQQEQNRWLNKEKSRKFHYNGVKPIMTFVGITEPMNLAVLWLLTIILTPFYLLNKLILGTIGALISGASDANRPKAVKGFIFTLLGIISLVLVATGVYLILRWLGIII